MRPSRFTYPRAIFFPLFIFIGIWIFVLVLYFTSPYQYNEISLKGWIYIFLSLSSFIMGYILYSILSIENIEPFKNDLNTFHNTARLAVQIDTRIIKYVILIISIITMVGILWKLNILGGYVGGIWEYLKNPIRARFYVTLTAGKIVEGYNIYDSIASYLMNLNLVNNMFGGLFFAAANRSKFYAWLPVVMTVLISVITFQRYLFLLSITIWMISALYIVYHLSPEEGLKAYKRFKISFILITIIFLLFIVSLLFVRLDLGAENKEEWGEIKVGELVLRNLHSYLVGNIVNFDNFIHRASKYYYGSSLFRNLFKWFARIGLYEEANVIGTGYEFSDVGFISLNTYSYMRIFYEDYGVFGLIGLSFMWGVGTCWVVAWYLKKFSLYRLYYLSLICHSLLMSFFSFSLLNIVVIIYASMVIFIINYIFAPIKYE